MDPVPLDSFRGLLEIDLTTGEQRHLINGEEAFSDGADNIVRIATGDKAARKAALTAKALPDSSVRLLLPSADLDSDSIFDLELWFYTGENPLVLLSGPEPLPRRTLDYVLAVVRSTVKDIDWKAGRYLDIARGVKNMGLWMLQRRTRQIEQSVRDALDDEEFSSCDYLALRQYPARLALVETAAGELREAIPKRESAKPKERLGFNVSSLAGPDPFYDHVDEAADNARNAVTRLSGLISSQQIVLTQRQGAETARFQRLVTIVGAAVLVPGLVAAIFGANVGFQGRESTGAFWAMLFLMAGSGIASYALIRSLEIGMWKTLGSHRPFYWMAKWSPNTRVLGCAALAVGALMIGVILLTESKTPDQSITQRKDSSYSNGKQFHGAAKSKSLPRKGR